MQNSRKSRTETDGPMNSFRKRVERELREDILPFWLKYTVDEEYGGFHGLITNDLRIDRMANKAMILNARILWTFAKGFKVYGDHECLKTAKRAYEYLMNFFWDDTFGGFYWMVDHLGKPVETKKRIYGQAFAVYALAEYAAASGAKEALEKAIELYGLIEVASHDARHDGYFETYERDWTLANEQRLSEADLDEKKSMNTHLHALEAYANLLRVWKDDGLRNRLKELLRIFLDHIIDSATHHFRMFFDEAWQDRSDRISFGHDIEGSWLICKAAGVLGDKTILEVAQKEAVRMAQAVYEQGVDTDGGLFYEGRGNEIIDADKHWWPQAEAVVGFLNAYAVSGKDHFLKASERSWEFIEKHIKDRERGEWYWMVSRDGTPNNEKEKVGPWKCPYHNSRTCFEVMERLDKIQKHQTV
jgi:mannobiose 2-epimerase